LKTLNLQNAVAQCISKTPLFIRQHAKQIGAKTNLELAGKIQSRASALQSIADQTRKVPERPGLKADARNLAAYLATRR
jgi:hypothetical protein